MAYHSVMKRNKLVIHTIIWMDLKGVTHTMKKANVTSLHDSIYIAFLK